MSQNPNSRPDGKLIVAVGSSRSGKTAYLLTVFKTLLRLLVWDVKNEYSEKFDELGIKYELITTPEQLANRLYELKTDDAVILYVPSNLNEYDNFCQCAWAWNLYKAMAVVLEETSDVTTPSKAPHWHGQLVRKGLGMGMDIFAVSQRPAESDKTTIGNASMIHCCRLSRAKDRKYMAEEMDVPLDTIKALKVEDLKKIVKCHFVQKTADGKMTTGILKVNKTKVAA